MSWIDLAALTLTLWCAAKGYIYGGYRMLCHYCGLLAALVVALFLQRPFSAYLNKEWQAEAIMVNYFTKNSDMVVEVGWSGQVQPTLPPLAGVVMQRLIPLGESINVTASELAMGLMATMFVKAVAVIIFFVFIAAVITLLIRVKYYGTGNKNMAEWQRFAGVGMGAVYGLTLSMVICIALDALSMLGIIGFWQQDLSMSYLAKMVAFLLTYI